MGPSNMKYWKVICNYGHVGRRKEISVSRYLETDSNCTVIDVLKIISEMPGVKKGKNIIHSMKKAELINKEQYERGKKEEEQNLFLQRLKDNSH